jgi:hypothetical protein
MSRLIFLNAPHDLQALEYPPLRRGVLATRISAAEAESAKAAAAAA